MLLRVVEVSLMICVTAAVLAFGGTEPISLAVIEVLLLSVTAAALYGWKDLEWRSSWRGAWVPCALMGLVVFQLLPLPAGLLRLLRPDYPAWNVTSPGSAPVSFSPLSIAPYNTRTEFIILVCCVAVYFFARTLGQDRGSRRRLMAWLLGLGSFEAVYGLVQYLSGWQKIFGYMKKYNLEEATGTYINRNHFAGFLELVIPFSLALVLYENSKMSRRSRGADQAGIKKILSGESLSRVVLRLFAAIVMVAGLFFSRSRMGMLAAASSLVIMAAFSGFQRKAGLWFSAAVVAGVTVLILWIGAGSALERFGSLGQEYTSAEESRLSLWRDTARLVGGHPLLGSGLGTFPVAFTAVQRTFLGRFVNHAHNDYLEVASDLGIPAAILFFGAIGRLWWRAAQKAASAEVSFERAVALGCVGSIAAILLHSLADFNLYIPANALVFSLILGLAAAISVAKPTGARREAYEA